MAAVAVGVAMSAAVALADATVCGSAQRMGVVGWRILESLRFLVMPFGQVFAGTRPSVPDACAQGDSTQSDRI